MNEVKSCPYCGKPCEADWCDVGVGYVQCGPFHCTNCGASEIGPHDEERELGPVEKETGWYGPGKEPGSSANVVEGKIVSADVARFVYRKHYPESATEEGRRNIRLFGTPRDV